MIKAQSCKPLIIISVLLFIGQSLAGQSDKLNQLREKYSKTDSVYHRQKVFIHTDKNTYQPGETIYMRSYLRDAAGRPDTCSRILHVCLALPDGSPALRQLHKLGKNGSHGQLHLPDSLQGGRYYLQAYTRLMRNYPKTQIFQKPIFINNPENWYFSDHYLSDIKKMMRKEKKLEISYKLKSGVLLAGKNNSVQVAVYGKKIKKRGADIFIKNSNKETILKKKIRISPLDINFRAEKGESYTLVLKSGIRQKKIELPPVVENSIMISDIQKNGQQIKVSLFSDKENSPDEFANQVVLSVRNEGKLFWSEKLKTEAGENVFTINADEIPGGYLRFILSDLNGKIISESIFNHHTETESTFRLTRKQDGDSIRAQIHIDGANPDSIDLSLSISARQPEKARINIQNQFEKYNLLPDKKFNHKRELKQEFFYPEKRPDEKLPELEYHTQKSISISGHVSKVMLDIPAKNVRLSLFVLNEFYKKMSTRTDDDGNFRFEKLNYPDTISIRLEAYKENGKKGYLIHIDEQTPPKLPLIYPKNLKAEKERLKTARKQRRKNYEGIHRSDSAERKGLYTYANRIIYFDQINTAGYSDALEVIAAFEPGISKYGESMLRGKSSFRLSSEPLYLLDNIPVSKSTIANLPPEQVQRVEIVKGSNAAIYGSRGANGIVAVFTKQGHKISIGLRKIKILGYHSPKKFKAKLSAENPTLLFEPYLNFSENGKAEISFPDTNAQNYYIEIQGTIGTKAVYYLKKL